MKDACGGACGHRASRVGDVGGVRTSEPVVDEMARKHSLDVENHTVGVNHRGGVKRLEFAVRYRQDDRVVTVGGLKGVDRDGPDGVGLPNGFGVGLGIVDVDTATEFLKLADDVDGAGIAQVGAVFLECDPKQQHTGAFDPEALADHALDNTLGDMRSHVVVEPTAGQNDLGMIADLLGFLCEVVRIDADAMTADQTGLERQKVPLGAGRGKDIVGVKLKAMKNHGQLVDKGDVDVSLGIFDDLGGFGDLDGGRAVGAG